MLNSIPIEAIDISDKRLCNEVELGFVEDGRGFALVA